VIVPLGGVNLTALVRIFAEHLFQPAGVGDDAAGRWIEFRLDRNGLGVRLAADRIDRGGHASISTTLNIYTHVVDASHRKTIEAVERELFPSVPNPRTRSRVPFP
jgi:hypothetical protein